MAGEDRFTHFDDHGNAVMVDIGGKSETRRRAVASGRIYMSRQAYNNIRKGEIKKGDVLGIARVAGIMAAKRVDHLIPLAHPILIDKTRIDFSFDDEKNAVIIRAEIGVEGKTGVEMEALTAVSVTALTIYDMCKAVDKSMVIDDIKLVKKSGGKSGDFERQE